jgi:hypothetical protein
MKQLFQAPSRKFFKIMIEQYKILITVEYHCVSKLEKHFSSKKDESKVK